LAGAAGLSPDEVNARVHQAVAAYQADRGDVVADDVAVLTMRLVGSQPA
jgi:hypothetical protein